MTQKRYRGHWYSHHESVEHDDRGVGSQAYTDYIRNLTPGEPGVKDKESKGSLKCIQTSNG